MSTHHNRTASFASQPNAVALSLSAAPQSQVHAQKSSGSRLSLKTLFGASLAIAGIGLITAQPANAQTANGAHLILASHRAPLPTKLEFDSKPIGFRHGVPVGGWSHLTLYPDGRYHFSGHFHVSGAPSYNVGLVWMVRSSAGQAFLFPKKGHLHGTFESGSRDCNWDVSGVNEDIRRSYAELVGSRAEYRANVNIDIASLISDVKQAVSTVGQVVKIVQVIAP